MPNKHNDAGHFYEGLVSELAKNAWTEAERANFDGTPERLLRLHAETNKSPEEIRAVLLKELNKTFPLSGDNEHGMVSQGPIVVNSTCPHHLMPARYHAYVAYLPAAEDTRVLGLSKPARLLQAIASRFVLQEQLCEYMADVLYDPQTLPIIHDDDEIAFHSDGAIVSLIGIHCCMSCRGVLSNARTMSTTRRGAFVTDPSLEARFMQNMQILMNSNPFGG